MSVGPNAGGQACQVNESFDKNRPVKHARLLFLAVNIVISIRVPIWKRRLFWRMTGYLCLVYCSAERQWVLIEMSTVCVVCVRAPQKFRWRWTCPTPTILVYLIVTCNWVKLQNWCIEVILLFLPRCIACNAVFPMSVCPSVCQTRELWQNEST